jgi:6-phosphofructokinase 1
MGRHCGYLALAAGVAGGAEAILVPELPTTFEEVAHKVHDAFERGQRHALVVVAEGAPLELGRLVAYLDKNVDRLGVGVRATTLGHVQRGGVPSTFDRLLGSRLGFAAVTQLARGPHGVVLGLMKGRVGASPLGEIVGRPKKLDTELLAMEAALTR